MIRHKEADAFITRTSAFLLLSGRLNGIRTPRPQAAQGPKRPKQPYFESLSMMPPISASFSSRSASVPQAQALFTQPSM